MHGYDGEALERVLGEYLGDALLGDSKVRLCIPSFEGEHSEVFVFKTPHHQDFRLDWREKMVKVALATSAAPTYFRPLDDDGYKFVDGGIWANNPVMIGLTEALTSFSAQRERIRILSLGCGSDLKRIGRLKTMLGGRVFWHDVIFRGHAATVSKRSWPSISDDWVRRGYARGCAGTRWGGLGWTTGEAR